MLKPDAYKGDSVIDSNINSINLEAISQIEKELEPYDLISIVFILYHPPDVALERLSVFERLSRDRREDLRLLYEWAQHSQTRPTWRHEFLEALAVCQVYNIVRKLGFRVHYVKKMYMPENIQVNIYIHPIKKALYKLCENITSDILEKLQNSLKTYDIDTTEYKHCELVFLELMCRRFIIIEKIDSEGQYHIEKLARIIDNFTGLKKFAGELRAIESKCNSEGRFIPPVVSSSSSSTSEETTKGDANGDKYTANAFEDLYKYINQLNLDEPAPKNLKSDAKKLVSGAYAIKNPRRVGVCYIINQEDFHPSKYSIESKYQTGTLKKRLGSDKDKIKLEQTMSSLNFEVIGHRNLDHIKTMEFIKNIVQYRIHPDDSIFMLCILSHGVRGHIYAADSVLVKVEDIQKVIDDGFQKRQLYDIPKVMILQACQVNNYDPPPTVVADSPLQHYLHKSHFLIYWATAPELEAYRIEKEGSIFIQMLCCTIAKYAAREHLYDIFTIVTDVVAKICTKLQRNQIPIFESTLRKKIYLQMPV